MTQFLIAYIAYLVFERLHWKQESRWMTAFMVTTGVAWLLGAIVAWYEH